MVVVSVEVVVVKVVVVAVVVVVVVVVVGASVPFVMKYGVPLKNKKIYKVTYALHKRVRVLFN